jgi:hypothetical protein
MRHLLAVLLATAAACDRAPKARPGDLDVTWRGAERGRFIAPLVARHCAETGLLELLAIRGDTGIGMSLFLLDSVIVQPADYRVVPGSQLEEPRPGASVAARWFTVTTIVAFEGVTGKVTLSTTGRALTGNVDAKFQALDRPDTLRLSGNFAQVPLVKADSSCRLSMKRNKM